MKKRKRRGKTRKSEKERRKKRTGKESRSNRVLCSVIPYAPVALLMIIRKQCSFVYTSLLKGDYPQRSNIIY